MAARKPIFVIQKHDASSLHYDFRLEIDGVLKSWAVPTEDHPLDDADFEGVIPAGQAGAGSVMVWDRGVYRNLRQAMGEDAASMLRSYAEGKLEVDLEGDKIRGGYALIRTDADDGSRWLLIKMDDGQADARRRPTSTEVRSVLTDRTMAEIHDQECGQEP